MAGCGAGRCTPQCVVLQLAAKGVLGGKQIDIAGQAEHGQRPQHGRETGRGVAILKLGEGRNADAHPFGHYFLGHGPAHPCRAQSQTQRLDLALYAGVGWRGPLGHTKLNYSFHLEMQVNFGFLRYLRLFERPQQS